MPRGQPSIAILTDMVSEGGFLRPRHGSDAVLANALRERLPELRVLLCDWSTLADGEGTPGACLALAAGAPAPVRVRLDGDVLLAHVLRIGYGAGRASPLRDKWALFFERLDVLRRARVPVVNGYEAIHAGHEKTYLLALSAAGVPVVRSEIWPTSTGLAELRARHAAGEWIVKPANGECGRMVSRLESLTEEDWACLRGHAGLAVLQPWVSRIGEGEASLIYCQGELVHSVLKLPRSGGFLTNGEHVGATWTEHLASSAEAAVARAAIAAFPGAPELCRIDLVQGASGPEVMEVEAVDPGYLGMPRARLAEVLAKLYRSRSAAAV